jgi:hypothetical protein
VLQQCLQAQLVQALSGLVAKAENLKVSGRQKHYTVSSILV